MVVWFIVLLLQLSIQTTESLQNKVGRKKHIAAEKNKPYKTIKNATRSGRKNANPRT